MQAVLKGFKNETGNNWRVLSGGTTWSDMF